jgi:hypothetical protein
MGYSDSSRGETVLEMAQLDLLGGRKERDTEGEGS